MGLVEILSNHFGSCFNDALAYIAGAFLLGLFVCFAMYYTLDWLNRSDGTRTAYIQSIYSLSVHAGFSKEEIALVRQYREARTLKQIEKAIDLGLKEAATGKAKGVLIRIHL